MERFKTKEYHPSATIKDKEPPLDRIHSLEGFPTLDKALDAIHAWAGVWHLTSAEVKVVYDYEWDDTVETIRVF